MHPVLLVTRNQQMADHIRRLALDASVPLVVRDTVTADLAGWRRAPLVLVGADQSERPPMIEHAAVVVVSMGTTDDRVWRFAVDMRAEWVVALPAGDSFLADRLDEVARCGLVVAVIGAHGGVGATSLATALAIAGARSGHGVFLIDGDPLGGGIQHTLGFDQDEEEPTASERPTSFAGGGQLTVLSWPAQAPQSIPAANLSAALRHAGGEADLVVVDVPRWPNEITAVALAKADLTVMVCAAALRGIGAAGRVLKYVAEHAHDVRLVVRQVPGGDIPPEMTAEALGLPLAGQFGPQPSLADARGDGSPGRHGEGPLGELCAHLARRLMAERHEQAAPEGESDA